MVCFVSIALIGYLLGSFPSGYIAGRIRGVDIRRVGSGNVGATNVTRVLGKQFGYSVFVVDFLKGFLSVLLALMIERNCKVDPTVADIGAATGGIFSVIGHSYPIWLGFKGGKGVATSLGVIFGFNWVAALIMCLVWIAIFKITRYVSVASMIAAITLPIAMLTLLLLNQLRSPVFFYFSLVLAVIIVVRHRSNLSRLRSGTEPRFAQE